MMIYRKKIRFLLSIFLSIFIIICSPIILAETVVDIDLSESNSIVLGDEIPPAWFLVFMADGGSLTGHAYVTWGRENPELQRSEQFCFGMYAVGTDKKQLVFGRVDGELQDRDCFSIGNTTHRLIVKVNEEIYNDSVRVYEKWNRRLETGELNYKLINSDCVSFLIEVANSVGINVPKRDLSSTFPQNYLEKLIKYNENFQPENLSPQILGLPKKTLMIILGFLVTLIFFLVVFGISKVQRN